MALFFPTSLCIVSEIARVNSCCHAQEAVFLRRHAPVRTYSMHMISIRPASFLRFSRYHRRVRIAGTARLSGRGHRCRGRLVWPPRPLTSGPSGWYSSGSSRDRWACFPRWPRLSSWLVPKTPWTKDKTPYDVSAPLCNVNQWASWPPCIQHK